MAVTRFRLHEPFGVVTVGIIFDCVIIHGRSVAVGRSAARSAFPRGTRVGGTIIGCAELSEAQRSRPMRLLSSAASYDSFNSAHRIVVIF